MKLLAVALTIASISSLINGNVIGKKSVKSPNIDLSVDGSLIFDENGNVDSFVESENEDPKSLHSSHHSSQSNKRPVSSGVVGPPGPPGPPGVGLPGPPGK